MSFLNWGFFFQKNGQRYTKKSMVTMKYGLQRHFLLKMLLKDVDIANPAHFKTSLEMFHAVSVQLKSEGLGAVTHKSAIAQEDLQKLYSSKALSTNTPHGLQNKVFVDFMLHFCNRGRENLREMKISDFEVKTDVGGTKYAIIKDRMTKNHRENDDTIGQGGRMYAVSDSDLCPVKSLEKYINDEFEYFWQRPKQGEMHENCVAWYDKCVVGKNTLGQKMKRLSEATELSRSYTNHCLQATCVTALDNSGFAGRQIMAVSGHKSESSLKHYAKVSSPQKKKMSETLSRITTGSAATATAPESSHANDVMPAFDLNFDDLLTASQEAYINNTIQNSVQQSNQNVYNISNCVVNINN